MEGLKYQMEPVVNTGSKKEEGAKKWPHYLDDGSERGFLGEWLF